MTKEIDVQRWMKFRNDVDRLNLRFPTTAIAQRTGFDRGDISRYITGLKPLSTVFLNKFYEVYKEELKPEFKPEPPTVNEMTLLEGLKARDILAFKDLVTTYVEDM